MKKTIPLFTALTVVLSLASPAHSSEGLNTCDERGDHNDCIKSHNYAVYTTNEIDQKINGHLQLLNKHEKSLSTEHDNITALENRTVNSIGILEKNTANSISALEKIDSDNIKKLDHRISAFEKSVTLTVNKLDQRVLTDEAFKSVTEKLRAVIREEIANQLRNPSMNGGK